MIFKVHKLKGSVTTDSWKLLPSRPIRGAEMDPMKFPSRVLYNLLKNMLDKFKARFPADSSCSLGFPVLTGCDDYLTRLHNVKLNPQKMMQTTLITADFGDAFTETGIDRLQQSISFIGAILGLELSVIDLMRKLVKLVFTNCYFYTPHGLYRQSRGMPMGDYSSRFIFSLVYFVLKYLFIGTP